MKWLALALTLASAVGFGYFLGDDPCVGMSYPEQDQCYLDNGYCYAYVRHVRGMVLVLL